MSKRLILSVALSVISHFIYGASTEAYNAILADSLKSDSTKNASMLITPYPLQQARSTLGIATYSPDNERIRNNSAGTSIINTLPGQVPNAPGFTYFNSLSGTLQSSTSSLLVVDGIPFNSKFMLATPVNTFDIQDATFLRGINGSSPFGSSGYGSTIVLHSKTGEDHSMPTFDFNSYTIYTWNKNTDITGNEMLSDAMGQSTSLAYSQDFGKVDTRISANHYGIPYSSLVSSQELSHNRYTVSANTGVSIGEKFSGRIFVQDSFFKHNYNTTETDNNFLNSNLRLKYDVVSWLNLSSTIAYHRNDYKNQFDNSFNSSTAKQDLGEKRVFGNIFITADHTFHSFRISPFVGIQLEKQDISGKLYQFSNGTTSYNDYKGEYETQSYIGGIHTSLKDVWHLMAAMRSDKLSVYGDKRFNIYSLSTAFVFSELIPRNSILTFGKVRFAHSETDLQFMEKFPFYTDSPFTTTPSAGNTKTGTELGSDLGFLNQRVNVSATYFRDRSEAVVDTGISMPGMPSFESYWLRTTGFETLLKTTPVDTKDVTILTAIIYSKSKIVVEDETSSSGSPSSSLGSSVPDWKGSWLNQLTWKNINFNFLIDIVKGGNYVTFTSGGLMVIDGSFAKLRELSMGYDVPFRSGKLQVLQISIIGRNLWLIDSKSGDDPEKTFVSALMKSVSLSVNLRF